MAKRVLKLVAVSKRAPAPRVQGIDPELSALRAKLAEAEETLRAIQSGDVDAVVVSGPRGERVYTLRGAEYAYHALVEAMNEGALTMATDGTVLYCNRQVARFLQLPAEKVIGGLVTSLVADSDREAFAPLFACALSGKPCKAEIHFRAQDASTAPAYVSLSRLPAEDAAAVCMIVTDLREHKKRDELIAVGNLARSILEHAGEAIAVCDGEGRIILANEALRALCGRNPHFDHFDRVLPLEMLASGEHEREPFSVSDTLSGKRIRSREVIYRRGPNRIKWLLLTAGPLADGSSVRGCVLTLVDITTRKEAEQALLRSEKLAATGQLAATIAHEINNPLTAIYNLLFLIQQKPGRDPVKRLAAEALREVARVSHIAKQTLAFYRDTSRSEKVSLAQVLDEVLLLFHRQLETRQATLEKDYAIAGEVDGYPGEMRQVFSNLIRNSIEALPPGGRIHLRIRRSHYSGKDGVGVFISDNGSGIRPEIRDRIFEPFFTTKAQKGTGLGLWVAKDLVEKHGGNIRVRSSVAPPHRGTCFHVFLPATKAKEERTRTASAGL